MFRGKRILLLLAAGVLAGAVVLQGFDPMGEVSSPKPPHLARLFSLNPGEWHGEEIPLGPNEFVSGKVSQVLKFDDVFNARYRKGSLELSLYIVYWGAGKMPMRLVASHTPDRCWSENGWECLEMRFDERRTAGATSLQEADWRHFSGPAGETAYVLFWHLIDGRAYDYGERFNRIPHPLEWWKDAIRQMVSGSREQYFIRLSSSEPFDQIWGDAGVQEIVRALAGLGLAERDPVGQSDR
ncbi:MAG: exosortase-associated EpsI family protein [Opitutaceae bacterium]